MVQGTRGRMVHRKSHILSNPSPMEGLAGLQRTRAERCGRAACAKAKATVWSGWSREPSGAWTCKEMIQGGWGGLAGRGRPAWDRLSHSHRQLARRQATPGEQVRTAAPTHSLGTPAQSLYVPLIAPFCNGEPEAQQT